jgi:hypothetical protein
MSVTDDKSNGGCTMTVITPIGDRLNGEGRILKASMGARNAHQLRVGISWSDRE